ncbi:MAG: tRNA (adenosine(37)-N6)-dimethylallyltransferase MiaA [Candidatus Latescibacteria bacterium]|nr:tRNA (adenosine(37)-N6)-dimethylallyltransferase MiaA [Candidatus Latescibacterota bacterium]
MLCKKKIIGLVGPTGVGKTDLGLELAQWLGSPIISVDARQLYCYMDIGTAKPTQQQLCRVEHHMIDCKMPDQQYSAGQFGRDARLLVEGIWQKGKVPVLVGGSGFYLQALLDGFYEDLGDYSAQRSQLLKQQAEGDLASMWQELGRLDPVVQGRLAPNDAQRIVRALEVARQGGGSLSTLWKRRSVPLPGVVFLFGLIRNRERIYRRIEQRADSMFAQGLIEEVRYILAKGYSPDSYGLSTMGYREVVECLQGKASLDSGKTMIKRRTRQYAKRQLTWFRRDRRIRWIDLDRVGFEGALGRMKAHINSQLDSQMALDS